MKDFIEKILRGSKTVAIVGISDKPERPSHRVAKYLKEHGYRIIPVNPKLDEVLGEKCYDGLEAIPYDIDIVDIFRKSNDVYPIVEAAIIKGVKVIWMQEGVINEEAAAMAIKADLDVIMDRCILKEHNKLSAWVYN